MKRLLICMMMAFTLDAASLVAPQESKAFPEVSFQIFYNQLSPYGHWVNLSAGYAWVPNDEADFTPYSTHGHWVYTDYGWTWVSDYAWGWAPFHYGRWDFDDDYGWYWMPDYQWSPAWVTWASCPGYYGWAPLRPGYDVDAVISGGYHVRPERWVFARNEFMGRPDLDRHFEPRANNLPLIGRSRMIGRTNVDPISHSKYAAGPDPREVQQATGRPVKPLALAPTSKPGQAAVRGNQLAMYRPAITKSAAVAPPKVESVNQLKPLPGRAPASKSTLNPGTKPMPTPGNKAMPNVQPSSFNRGLAPGRMPNSAASPAMMRNQRNQMPVASPAFNRQQQSNSNLLRQLPRQAPQQQAPRAMPERQNAPQRIAPQQQIPQAMPQRQNAPQRMEPQQQAPRAMPQRQNAPQRMAPPQQQRVAPPPVRNAPAPQMRAMPQQMRNMPTPQMHSAPPVRNMPAPQMHSAPPPQMRPTPQMRSMPAPQMRSAPPPQMHAAPPPQMHGAPHGGGGGGQPPRKGK